MPTYEVRDPDGRLLEFEAPAGASQAELLAYAKANAPKPEKSLGATILDKAKLYGSAGLRGLASTAAMASDAVDVADRASGRKLSDSYNPLFLGIKKLRELIGVPDQALGHLKSVSEFGPKPESGIDKLVVSGIEGMTSALSGPGARAAPALTALAGTGGGLAAEGAAQATGSDNPLLRLAAGLTGSLGTRAAAGRVLVGRPQSTELAREALEGQSPEALKKAQDFMRYAETEGIQLDLAQALTAVKGGSSGAGNVQVLRDLLAQVKSGNIAQSNLRNQAGQLELAVDRNLSTLPGQNVGAAASANDVQKASTGAIELARQARTAKYDADLQRMGGIDKQVDESDAKSVLRLLDEHIKQFPGTAKESWLKDLRARLLDRPATAAAAPEADRVAALVSANGQPLIPATQAAQAAERPLLDVRQINEVLKERSNVLKAGGPNLRDSGVDIGTAKWLSSIIDRAREGYGTNFAPIREANKGYREFTEQVVNPLKQGPVGLLAKRGYADDVQANLTAFDTILKRGTSTTATTSEIRTLGREMAKAEGGREAFANAVQTSLRTRIDDVFEAASGGQTAMNLDAPAKMLKEVFGSPARTRGLKEAVATMVEQTAGQQAVPAALAGLDKVHKLMQATANTTKPQGLSQGELYRMAGRSASADSLRVFGFLPFERAARRLEDAVMQKTFREFDQLLTTPEGIDTLIKLAKVPHMSPTQAALLGAFFGTAPEIGKAVPDQSAGVNTQ